jgi:hypothetical protein
MISIRTKPGCDKAGKSNLDDTCRVGMKVICQLQLGKDDKTSKDEGSGRG